MQDRYIRMHSLSLLYLMNWPVVYTYFEEHDVITTYSVVIIWMLARGYTIPHFVINLLEIVGAQNNTCGVAEKVIITMCLLLIFFFLIAHAN